MLVFVPLLFFPLFMQLALDIGQTEALIATRNRLLRIYDPVLYDVHLDPADQMIRSILGSRTKDAMKQAAFRRLRARFSLPEIAAVQPKDIEPLIAGVEFADRKAEHIVIALRRLKAISGDFRLDFLDDWNVDAALRYLEAFHGVGRKIAAATLNFSTLRKPALVIDTHVLRVLQRLGFLPPHIREAGPAYDRIMPALDAWSAEELHEFHWLLKQLGQELCGALRTDCRSCPLQSFCLKRGVRTFH
jgi:endonuclease-3